MADRPLNILFLTHYFPPEGNAPATRVFGLCRRWVEAGHRVTVITGAPNVPDGKVYPGYLNKLRQRELMAGIDVVRVWTYLAPNKGMVRRVANFLSFMLSSVFAGCFQRRPDVLIATSPQFFCGWAGALLGKFHRVPFILEIRDLWPESIKGVGAMRGPRLLACLEWLEVKLYTAADHIVTVGEGYLEQLRKRGVPRNKMSIIPNGVDREQFASPRTGADVRKKHGLAGKFVCSYIGTVGMASGLEVVLRAAAKLKTRQLRGFCFLIVGDGAVLEELRNAAKLGGLDNVVFTGRQAKESMPDYLAASDACLVHLKRRELFTTVMPSKIFEALAMARPIILGVEGFAAEFIRASGGGMCIEPENEDALILALERLANEPPLAAAFGASGRDYVFANFDRDQLAKNYLEQIQTVLRPRGL